MSNSSRPLGRPVQKVRPTKNLEEKSSEAPVREEKTANLESSEIEENKAQISGRSGDNMLGRPIQKPRELESSRVSRADLERELEEAELEEIYAQPIKLPLAWLSGLWLILLLFFGIIGWFVFAQILSTLQIILQLPTFVQVIAWVFVIFFSFIVFYPVSRLLMVYYKLKPVKQIQMTRVTTKNLSTNQLLSAKQTISEYLQNYPLEDRKFSEQLEQLGLSESEQRKLQNSKQHLLEVSPQTTAEWLEEFERDFLKPVDAVIKARIQYYAKLLALKAALSPNALIDMAVVLYNGFSLLRDICTLYQVRVGRLGTLYLLGLIVFQSYVAGQIEHHMDGVENWMEGMLSESILGATGAKIASFASSKASEAAIHYFFLRRIGNSMMARLRPLSTA